MPKLEAGIVNKLGLHARAAAKLTHLACGFQCEIWISRSGRRTVPQIFIGDHHVGGSDNLADLEAAGKLDGLLGR